MTRDDDYLRDLLIGFEEHEGGLFDVYWNNDGDEEDDKRYFHTKLLADAGFIKSVNSSKVTYRITNDGHDYLAAVRDEGVWKKTKEGAAKMGGASLGIMKDIAIAYLKTEAKEKLGITL